MAQRIFFFDFDRTLYSYETHTVPTSASNALRRLQEQGDVVVVATGRAPGALQFIREKVGIPVEWMIAMNGQLLYHGQEKVYEHFIRLLDMEAIIQTAQEHSFACGGYYAGGNLVNVRNDRVRNVWETFGQPLPEEVPWFWEKYSLYHGHLYITTEEAELYFAGLLDGFLTNWSHPTLMNLISRETGKSAGVYWLMKRLGIPRENAYAFGDGFNDVDLLESVGHGIAMGNADEALKAVAEYIAPLPDEDGILCALQWYGVLE